MPDARSFHHVLLTVFNCARSYTPAPKFDSIRSQPGWMELRLDLFERYCLPTVLAQSNVNFTWMLYFDRNTSEHHLERVKRGLGVPECRHQAL